MSEPTATARPVSEFVAYFLRLGLLGFGGPVALVGQMEHELVTERGWLTKEQMREAIAVCQSLPGPLAELIGADAEELALGRRLGADGRTRAYINGRAANVSDLRELGALLLSFYGQHEHRKLTLAAAQLQILDATCGAAHAQRLAECAGAHARVQTLRARLDELAEMAGQRERELS